MDTKEKLQFVQKIDEHFRRFVMPNLAYLEQYRLKELKKYKMQRAACIILFIAILLTPFFLFWLSYKFNFPTLSFITVIMAIPFLIIGLNCAGASYSDVGKNIPKKFREFIKNRCIVHAVQCFDNLTWKTSKLDADNLYESNLNLFESDLFSTYNEVKRDDIFDGKYKDIPFHIEEISLINRGSKNTGTVFNGLVITLPPNKTVKAKTIVQSRTDSSVCIQSFAMFYVIQFAIICTLVSLAYSSLKQSDISEFLNASTGAAIFIIVSVLVVAADIYRSKKIKKIKLEDVAFEKQFIVHSEDQMEARFLVTPAFMERLKNLQTVFGTNNIKCSFREDSLMFAISTDRDLFEFGDLFVPLTDPKQIRQLIEEMIAIYDMIDYFKLAEKTGM